MKIALLAALAAATLSPAAIAQTAPAPATAAAAAAAAKFNLDTPVQELVADARAKAVLDADLPGVSTHESYEMFKAMSLRQLMPLSEGKLTPEMLAKVEKDLAAIK